MKNKFHWLLPRKVANLLLMATWLLTVGAVPLVILNGLVAIVAYHKSDGDVSAVANFGLIMSLICFVLGWISLRFCIYSLRHHEAMELDVVKSIAKEIVDQLVLEHYDFVLQRCDKCHLNVEQLRSIMHDYGKEVTPLNAGVYDKVEFRRKVKRTSEAVAWKWAFNAFLWTENERKLDLTLELTMAFYTARPTVELIGLYPS